MYPLFVPARARLAFPCFDQPDIKARYALTLDVPAGWAAVSNAVETRRHPASAGTTIGFDETQPISTSLFACVISPSGAGSKPSFFNRRRWRASGGWPAALPTISITS